MLSNTYIMLIILMGILFFVTAILVLYWCIKTGQLKNFEENSRCIFSEDEPEGVGTDCFPGAYKKSE